MSLAIRVRANYKRELTKFGTVTVRRYYGASQPRAKYERACRARDIDFRPEELVGPIVQGDWKIILLAEDMESGDVTLPLLYSDKIVSRGKEAAIVGIDDKKRRIGDVICAYELHVRA